MKLPRRQIQKLYKTRRWRAKRARQLKLHPYCQCPHCEGCKIPADTVDHVEPHNGDPRKFWGGELQSMTKQCHDKFKQSQEKGGVGFKAGSDVSGEPLDKSHPWYG